MNTNRVILFFSLFLILMIVACGPESEISIGENSVNYSEMKSDDDYGLDSIKNTKGHIDTKKNAPNSSRGEKASWVTINAGTFWMGSPETEAGRTDAEILHEVTLTRNFKISKYETTQAEYTSVMGWNPSFFGPNNPYPNCGDDCPVENVTHYDAMAYANKLSSNNGYDECYQFSDIECDSGYSAGTNYMSCQSVSRGGIHSATVTINDPNTQYNCEGFRLPTEAEWEYAARAGTTTAFYNGGITNTDPAPFGCNSLDPNLNLIAWYCANDSNINEVVGQKQPNNWNLFDMLGNVNEMTMKVPYSGIPIDPEFEPDDSWEYLWPSSRGGNTGFPAINCRSAQRTNYGISSGRETGFRPVRSTTFTCGGCDIDGQCYDRGVVNPGNPCQLCDWSESRDSWSDNDGVTCNDGDPCNGNDTCTGGACDAHNGNPCETPYTCEPGTGECLCDGCDIGGICYQDEEVNTENNCEKCDSALSTTTWSPNDGVPCDDEDYCNGNDNCMDGTCSEHSGNPCSPYNCVEEGEHCGTTCVECLIGDVCYQNGDLNPENSCTACDIETSLQQWTNLSDLTSCDDGAWCNGQDQCDTGQCTTHEFGISNPRCNTPLVCDEGGQQCVACSQGCKIEDVCFADGAQKPDNQCLICNKALSNSSWSFNDGVDCNDGDFCNGTDTCASGICEHGGDPCTDDGKYCNGSEYCHQGDQICAHTTTPEVLCPDNGDWCDGEEYCNEDDNGCDKRNVPDCSDDGNWCTGEEFCNDAINQCDHKNVPDCPDDQLWCNGDESCSNIEMACVHEFGDTNPRCPEDGQYCNGEEYCNEELNECAVHDAPQCNEDNDWCNGEEFCSNQIKGCDRRDEPCESWEQCLDQAHECIPFGAVLCYRDRDSDGFGNPSESADFVANCPDGWVANNEDCNDDLVYVYPDAPLTYGTANDCGTSGNEIYASNDIGIFVAKNGSDSNLGTKEQPLKTIAAGIEKAEQAEKVVFVAEGEYEESVITKVSIHGGFYESSWGRTTGTKLTIIRGGVELWVENNNITLDNVKIINSGNSQIGFNVIGSAGKTTVIVCEITGADDSREGSSSNSYLAGSDMVANNKLVIMNSKIEGCAPSSSGHRCTGLNIGEIDTEVRISDSIISGGPGIGTVEAIVQWNGHLTVMDSKIIGGIDANSFYVYGIHSQGGKLVIHRSTIEAGNSSSDQASVATAVSVESSAKAIITNSVLVGPTEEGFNYKYGAMIFGETILINNILDGGSGGGFQSSGLFIGTLTKPITILNNIIMPGVSTNNLAYAINTQASGDLVKIANNDLWGDDVNCLVHNNMDCLNDIEVINQCNWSGCHQAANNFSGDPFFTTTAFPHIRSESPCIDTGTDPITWYHGSFEFDFENEIRPNENGFDVGPDESPFENLVSPNTSTQDVLGSGEEGEPTGQSIAEGQEMIGIGEGIIYLENGGDPIGPDGADVSCGPECPMPSGGWGSLVAVISNSRSAGCTIEIGEYYHGFVPCAGVITVVVNDYDYSDNIGLLTAEITVGDDFIGDDDDDDNDDTTPDDDDDDNDDTTPDDDDDDDNDNDDNDDDDNDNTTPDDDDNDSGLPDDDDDSAPLGDDDDSGGGCCG